MYFRRIADLRTDHDKTQQEIAEVLNCNRHIYGRYERGLQEIPVFMIAILAEYYNVSMDYILGITDIKEPYPKRES